MRRNKIMGQDYEDILHLPHHVSAEHPQMSIADRAAQFSPFAALTGYDAAVQETARLTEEQLELDENQKAVLNRKLLFLQERLEEHPVVEITYFQPDEWKAGGHYVTVSGNIKKIDLCRSLVIMADGIGIPMAEVFEIKGELPEQI